MRGTEACTFMKELSMVMCFMILPIKHYSQPCSLSMSQTVAHQQYSPFGLGSVHHSQLRCYIFCLYILLILYHQKKPFQAEYFFQANDFFFFTISSPRLLIAMGICKCQLPLMIVSVTSIMTYFSVYHHACIQSHERSSEHAISCFS